MKKIPQIFLLLSILLISLTGCEKEDPYTPPATPLANAGDAQTVRLPINFVDVSGTGTSDGGVIVGYLWSLVSGPNVPVIVSPSSAATTVKGLVSGDYLFQFMVIDDQGLTGVDTISIKVMASENITLTLQPANNNDEIYFLGKVNGAGHAQISPPEMGVIAWTINGVESVMRTALRFNLSAIPSNAMIVSAKLSLYSSPDPINGNHSDANAGSDNTLFIERITSPWNSSNLTWATQPASTATNRITVPSTSQPFLDLIDMDVSMLVKEMIKSNNNHGFWLRLKDEIIYKSRIFGSSKHADAKKHPKLVVVYKLQ